MMTRKGIVMSIRMIGIRLVVVAIIFSLAAFVIGVRPTQPVEAADPPKTESLAADFKSDVRPLLNRYCHQCHNEKRAEAEIDLDLFASLTDVRKAPRIWQKVSKMLEDGD